MWSRPVVMWIKWTHLNILKSWSISESPGNSGLFINYVSKAYDMHVTPCAVHYIYMHVTPCVVHVTCMCVVHV